MQICFYFPFLKNNQNEAFFGGMYHSFFLGLEKLGIRVNFTTKLSNIKGDVLVLVIGGGLESDAAKAMHFYKGPVVLYVHNAYLNFNKNFLKRWKSRIILAYNPDYATLNFKKYLSVNIPYYHFPFGSDEDIFYPLNIEKKYDLVFLGNGNSGYGRDKYIKRLVEYTNQNRLKVFLAGTGWEKYGFPKQIIKHGAELNEIYNSGKICINIHNDRQYLGLDLEMDANNRLFDLAMSQSCQISNGEEMIIRYFTNQEVITADEPEKWIEKIDYYLKHKEERERIAYNARKRALSEHTWSLRAEEFKMFVTENIKDYNSRSQKICFIDTIFRYIDQFIIPTYLLKEIRIIRYFLIKIGKYVQK